MNQVEIYTVELTRTERFMVKFNKFFTKFYKFFKKDDI